MPKHYTTWNRTITIEGRTEPELEYFLAHASERTAEGWATLLGRSTDAIRRRAVRECVELKAPPVASVVPTGELPRAFQGIDGQALVKALRERPCALEDLSRTFDRSEMTILAAIDEMQAAGYGVCRRDRQVEMRHYDAPQPLPHTLADEKQSSLTLALYSDTHCGDKTAQPTALRAFLQEAREKYGATVALHCGDLTAGLGVYAGQVQDLQTVSAEEQIEIASERIPTIPGLHHYVLGGNHDFSFYRAIGLDVVQLFCSKREDMTYVGSDFAQIPLTPDLDVAMWHPAGGVPYALCLSQDSQILTRRGWASWHDISMSDEIATLNPDTHALEYQAPTALHVYEYEGPMVSIISRTVDLLVTPNHDLYVREYPERSPGKPPQPWHKEQAGEVRLGHKRQKRQMMMDIERWEGAEPSTFTVPEDKSPGTSWNRRQIGDVPIEVWLSFLGWYISEGHLSPKRVEITQKAGPKLECIVKVMRQLGYEVAIYDHSKKANTKRAVIHAMQIVRWLAQYVGKGAANKRVPRFIMDLSPRLIKVFLDALFAGDGWFDSDGDYAGYASISPQLRDDVQELLLKIGLASTITENGLSVIKDQRKPTINAEPEMVDYMGKVWCVTVPNGLIYARRNGRAIWTGNSYRGQRFLNQLTSDELEKVVLGKAAAPRLCLVAAGHLHQSMYFRSGHIAYFQLGCFEGRNSFFKRKGWKPAIGGYVVDLGISEESNMLHVVRHHDIWYYEIEQDYQNYPRYAKKVNAEIKPLFWIDKQIEKGIENGTADDR